MCINAMYFSYFMSLLISLRTRPARQSVVGDQRPIAKPLAVHSVDHRSNLVDGVLLTKVVPASELLYVTIQMLW